MEFWAHALVKNEARWLWYSVSSVIEHVDKLLLWDTGSTDDTLRIIKELKNKYPKKIESQENLIGSAEEFPLLRQAMLDRTSSDWFMILDGDEIWWEDSITRVKSEIMTGGESFESVVVPTINLTGDIYHFQDQSAGKYHLAGKVGHYNLRVVKRNIEGLHSFGRHGVWGWVDKDSRMIQDRDPRKIKYLDAPYVHATNVRRSSNFTGDQNVIKRKKKLKYDLGNPFPLDFYYPEVFFRSHPDFIESPWEGSDFGFKVRATFETPLRKLKRKIFKGGVGY